MDNTEWRCNFALAFGDKPGGAFERLNNVKLENKIWRSGLFALTLQSLSPERQANIESLTIKDEQYKSRGRRGMYVRRKFFNSVNFDQAQ